MSQDRLQEFVIFSQIAESGSFTAAARALDLTPSAVSKIVSRLEKKFGVRLFNRTTHEVRLSEEGKLVLEKATKILEAVRSAEGLKDDFSSSPAGRLTVYSLPSFALSQLSAVLPAFLKQYPDIRIDIQLGTESINSVTSEVDVVLRYGHVEDSALICRRIAESQWVICASPEYLAQHGVPETPKDLVRHNCLSFSLKTMQIPWSVNSPSDTIKIDGNVASNHAPMLRELALRNVGIIRVADFVVANDIRSGALQPVLTDYTRDAHEPVYAIYQPQPIGSQRIRAFVDFLYQQFSGQPWLIDPSVNSSHLA